MSAATPAGGAPEAATSRSWLARFADRPEAVLIPVVFVVVIGGWELIVRLFHIPRILLPAPSAVAVSLYQSLRTPAMLSHLMVTFTETMAGFALGALFGLTLGTLISQFPLLESTIYPYVVAFQTLPKVAIAPIVVIWFGYGMASKIVLTAMIAFFPLLANTIVGLRAIQQEQLELLAAFTATRWQIFRMVKVFQALPYVFVGLDVAIILSVIGAIVGEFVGSQAGLGYLILQRNFSLDMAGVFAILTILALMGMGLHYIVQYVQRRVVFWMEVEQERIIGA